MTRAMVKESDSKWLTPEFKQHEEWVRLKAEGWHYTEIARRFNVLPGDVRDVVNEHLSVWAEKERGNILNLETYRLDRIEKMLWAMLEEDRSVGEKLETAKVLLKVREQNAKLHGLNQSGDVIINNGATYNLGNLTPEQIMEIASQPLVREIIEGESREIT